MNAYFFRIAASTWGNRLTPILEKFDSEVLGIEKTDHYIEGVLDQYVIVSVPECTNMARAEEIKAQVMTLVKKPVVVISHNISLLKAVKLSASEAANAIRQGEEYETKTRQNAESVVP